MALSRYQHFTRAEWARLRADTPLTLAQDDLTHLRGLNERVSLDEVVEIYLPLSRLLNLHVGASQAPHGREINEPNLLEDILPTRDRAHLILTKGPDHAIQHVRLRKL